MFETARFRRENVLGEHDHGVKVLMSGLNTERLVLTGGPAGLMQAALDIALPYVRERKQFDQPIGTFGIMQAKIADMYTALQSCRAFAYAGGARLRPATPRASTRRAASCTRRKQAVTGVAGGTSRRSAATATSTSTRPAALLRDAKLYEIGAGTNEIRRMLIGRELFNGNF